MAEKSFHLFPWLPTELRLEIWRLCLPSRVWEVDFPTDEALYPEPNSDDSYPCNVISTAKLNGLPPVITRVCQESHNVAHESGGVVPDDFYDDLPDGDGFVSFSSVGIADDFWLDTKRDSAHLNWNPLYQAIYQNSAGSALALLTWQCRQVVGRPSIMGDWFEGGRFDQKEERFDVFDQVPSWWVVMHVVIIHTSFRDAARSGLFGLLGDASVQIVSVSDEEKIKAFYDFADEHDRQTSTVEGFQRVSSEALKQKLKADIIKEMRSENLLSKMHPAIMFRVCTLRCNSSRKEGLSS